MTSRIEGFKLLRFHYHVFGLYLSANREIPGLEAEKVDMDRADIEINMGFFPDHINQYLRRSTTEYYFVAKENHQETPHLIINTLAEESYFHFCYAHGVEFVLDQSATIVWGIWKESLFLEDASLYLLGPILGFMLRLRGMTCLHASGVVINDKAFALAGPSGVGKSTLAASFAAEGYPVLTDDIMPLTIVKDSIYAHSGYSRLRLFPNSFENMPELPDKLPSLTSGWDKCYLDLACDSYKMHEGSAELKVIYIIDWEAENTSPSTIAALSGGQATTLLAANTYRNELLSTKMRKKEFFFLGQLVSKIKVKKIYPDDGLSRIVQLRAKLLDDFYSEIKA